MKYIVLLRGINISGKNKISMNELKAGLEKIGFENVSTYLNSGNAIFQSEIDNKEVIKENIQRMIKERFNLEIPVYVTTAPELEDILKHTPEWWGTNNKEIYANNAEKYTQKLYELQNKFNQINANGTKAICLNESLEYLLREVGIESTLIETDHDQSAISAEMMSKIISKMKDENIKTIFIDKNDDTKKAETLVKETGATIYRLDSGMTGNENKQSYIDTMNYNYNILTSIK